MTHSASLDMTDTVLTNELMQSHEPPLDGVLLAVLPVSLPVSLNWDPVTIVANHLQTVHVNMPSLILQLGGVFVFHSQDSFFLLSVP